MNDCVWLFLEECDGEMCQCMRYLSINTEEGREIYLENGGDKKKLGEG